MRVKRLIIKNIGLVADTNIGVFVVEKGEVKQ
jgi:hypothetical protein